MIIAKAQFFGRGDHAVGDVSVGFPGSNLETARQHGAWQGDDNFVALDKVVCPADNSSGSGSVLGVGLGDSHLTPPDGFAVGLGLVDKRLHLSDDDWAGDVEGVDVFFFQSHRHQGVVQGLGGERRGGLDVLPKPGQGHPH